MRHAARLSRNPPRLRPAVGAKIGRNVPHPAPVSVVIPAYNEEAVIGRCLTTLMDGAEPGELQVVVACNGCTDRTAERAREFGPAVQVVDTPRASKTAALNLGDDVASVFPRIYLDADVTLRPADWRAVAAALRDGSALAAAPTMEMDFEGASWPVRAYYRIWQLLPYVREGMIGSGCYALSAAGRARFDEFPDVIADDGYVRMLFTARERARVEGARSRVVAPRRLDDLLKIKRRSRLGGYELRERFPELAAREQAGKSYGGALGAVAQRPWLWPHAAVYGWVNLAARRSAARALASREAYSWDRDEASREAASPP